MAASHLHPAAEQLDLFSGPGAVAGHRAGGQRVKDLVRFRAHIVVSG